MTDEGKKFFTSKVTNAFIAFVMSLISAFLGTGVVGNKVAEKAGQAAVEAITQTLAEE